MDVKTTGRLDLKKVPRHKQCREVEPCQDPFRGANQSHWPWTV